MSEDTDGLIDQVASLMVAASQQFIMPYHNNLSSDDVATKTSDTDYVTIADRNAEFWLVEMLASLIDDVVVIGEESISDTPSLSKHIARDLTFVIDPIDGTRNFVNGDAHFCSMVSLIDKGEPLVAWILRPLEQDIFVSVADDGNYRMDLTDDGRLTQWQECVRHSERRHLHDMIGTGGLVGLSGRQRDEVRGQLRALANRRLIGSAGCEAILMATGEHDFLMHARTTAWDHTPVDLFARGADMYVASLPSHDVFSPLSGDAILAAPDEACWFELANHIWPEPVIR